MTTKEPWMIQVEAEHAQLREAVKQSVHRLGLNEMVRLIQGELTINAQQMPDYADHWNGLSQALGTVMVEPLLGFLFFRASQGANMTSKYEKTVPPQTLSREDAHRKQQGELLASILGLDADAYGRTAGLYYTTYGPKSAIGLYELAKGLTQEKKEQA